MAGFTFPGGEVVSALGGMASSALSAAMSYKYSKKLMKFQQKWQEKMSNSAHQREVTDLKKAGLNPILSGTGGDGASSGAASGATVSADFDNPVSAYMEYKTNKLNQDLLKAQEKNTTSNTYKTNNETDGIIADNMFKHEINEATYEKLLSEVKTNTALQQVYVADEIGKSIDNLFRYDRNNRELDKLKAEASSLIINASANARNATSNAINAQSNAQNAKGNYYYNTHRSTGYSSHVSLPFGLGSWSHTGDPWFSAKGINSHTQYEYDSKGHKVPVRVYD